MYFSPLDLGCLIGRFGRRNRGWRFGSAGFVEFALGHHFDGAAHVAFQGDGFVALAFAVNTAAFGVALELSAAYGSNVGTIGLGHLHDFDHLGSERVVGTDAATLTFSALVVAAVMAGEGHLGKRVISEQLSFVRGVPTIANVRQLWATHGWRKGDSGRGVEIEVGRQAILGSDVDVGSRLSGFVKAGLPFLGMAEATGSHAEDGEQKVGGVAVDGALGNCLGKLGQCGVNRMHGFKRRQVEFEALAAGTGLGHAKAAGAITKMMDTEALSCDGEGFAGAAGVVDMRASLGHKFSVNEKGLCLRHEPLRID